MDTNGSFQPITPDDLKDPTLFKINNTMGLLWSKLNGLYGSSQTADLKSKISAQQVSVSPQTQIPTDDNTLITLGTAKRLFGPEVMRQALVTGKSPLGENQPLPPMGGDTATIDLTTYTGTLTFSGGRLIKHT